jgi:probable rRNA maturation factor
MVPQMASGRTRPAVTISSSQRVLRVPRKRIDELIAYVAAAERARIAEVDVAVVGAEEMAALNRRFLGRRGASDVLSFDLSQSPAARSGQVVVCADAAVCEAAARHARPQHELMLYVVHGLLHLMGYDDGDRRRATEMHARQEQLLAGFLTARRRCARRGRG